MIYFFTYYWIKLANTLLKIFVSNVHEGYWCVVFSVPSLVPYQVTLPHKMSWGLFPPLYVLKQVAELVFFLVFFFFPGKILCLGQIYQNYKTGILEDLKGDNSYIYYHYYYCSVNTVHLAEILFDFNGLRTFVLGTKSCAVQYSSHEVYVTI